MQEIDDFQIKSRTLKRNYFVSTISNCYQCLERLPEAECNRNCTKPFKAFTHCNQLVNEKLEGCLAECGNNNKCKKQCYINGEKDLNSLSELLKRTFTFYILFFFSLSDPIITTLLNKKE